MRLSAAIAALCLLSLASAARVARAEELRVQVTGDGCPDVELVLQKLAPLLPEHPLVTEPELPAQPGAITARVHDAGERYAVSLGERGKELEDVARDCVERARVAAVFIALNVKPESAPEPKPEPEPEDEEEEDADAEAAASATAPRDGLGLRLFGQGAYSTTLERGAAGGGLGVWLGRSGVRVAFTAGLLSPAEVALESTGDLSGSVSLLRVPLAIDASFLLELGRLELGPSLGFVVDVLHLRGQGVPRAQSELRVNPGIALQAEGRVWLGGSLFLLVRAGATGYPRAYDLAVDPLGRLGRTPRIWLGASLGVDLRL